MKYLPSLNYCFFKPKLSCKGHPADFIHKGKLIAIPTGSILQPGCKETLLSLSFQLQTSRLQISKRRYASHVHVEGGVNLKNTFTRLVGLRKLCFWWYLPSRFSSREILDIVVRGYILIQSLILF